MGSETLLHLCVQNSIVTRPASAADTVKGMLFPKILLWVLEESWKSFEVLSMKICGNPVIFKCGVNATVVDHSSIADCIKGKGHSSELSHTSFPPKQLWFLNRFCSGLLEPCCSLANHAMFPSVSIRTNVIKGASLTEVASQCTV